MLAAELVVQFSEHPENTQCPWCQKCWFQQGVRCYDIKWKYVDFGGQEFSYVYCADM